MQWSREKGQMDKQWHTKHKTKDWATQTHLKQRLNSGSRETH
jgi:hypothetical protein